MLPFYENIVLCLYCLVSEGRPYLRGGSVYKPTPPATDTSRGGSPDQGRSIIKVAWSRIHPSWPMGQQFPSRLVNYHPRGISPPPRPERLLPRGSPPRPLSSPETITTRDFSVLVRHGILLRKSPTVSIRREKPRDCDVQQLRSGTRSSASSMLFPASSRSRFYPGGSRSPHHGLL